MSHALAEWETDQNLYLFTSLTAGSSHIVTATSRIETILRANRLPFTYIDTATSESARKLWGRRGRGKKLPALVKEGEVLGDLAEIEEWNEFGELKDVVGKLPPPGEKSITTTPAKMAGPYSNPPSNTASPAAPSLSSTTGAAPASPSPATKRDSTTTAATSTEEPKKQEKENTPISLAMRNIGAEAAAKAGEKKKKATEAIKASLTSDKTPTSGSSSKEATNESNDAVASPKSPTRPSADVLSRSSSTSEPAIREHRGSSLSLASDEQIKEVENASRIDEEDEDEDEDEGKPAKPSATASEGVETASVAKDKKRQSTPQEDMQESLRKISVVRSDEQVNKSNSVPGDPGQKSDSLKKLEDAQAVAAHNMKQSPTSPPSAEKQPQPAEPTSAVDKNSTGTSEPRAAPADSAAKAKDAGAAQGEESSEEEEEDEDEDDDDESSDADESPAGGKVPDSVSKSERATQEQTAGAGDEAGESVDD